MSRQLTAQDWGRLIGCKVITPKGIGALRSIRITAHGICLGFFGLVKPHFSEGCSPILRTLDQMTEEENQAFKNKFGTRKEFMCGYKLPHYDFFDSILIDQRDWIDAGLAIKEGDECLS